MKTKKTPYKRGSGILLHITSLPSVCGIGDLGYGVDQFLNFSRSAEIRYWQILPVGPTGYGDSPYQSYSAFAGNPLLISPELLVEEGLLNRLPSEVPGNGRVDYDAVRRVREQLLHDVFEQFQGDRAFTRYRNRQKYWLRDYALFMVIRQQTGGKPWWHWETGLRDRDSTALSQFTSRHAREIEREEFVQWLFSLQWKRLQKLSKQSGVRLIGDMPIFVAADSADVWSHPELFKLTRKGTPRVVAGVPPDYFSADGQLWGNPVYDWETMRQDDYAWWKERFRHQLKQTDLLRVDHFRGFVATYEVPGRAKTARRGKWVPGPGADLFTTLQDEFGSMPLIAEDLGVITPEVRELRDRFAFPGMKILQFAFDGDTANAFLPHTWKAQSVAYTGTHDNDTTRGWWNQSGQDHERAYALEYLRTTADDFVWDMVRTVIASPADIAIIPMQDLLNQNSDQRMNLPGSATGNWRYRINASHLSDELAVSIRRLNRIYGRSQSRWDNSVEDNAPVS